MSGAAPLVSVVVPVWNGERTLAATLASVLAQSHRHFELLVIDDGSTDGTAALVSGLATGDPRVQLHRFENRGLAASRNRGIRLARGEFIAFVDADDLWQPARLERQLAALAAAPAAGLAYSLTDCIDDAGQRLGPGSHIVAAGRVYARLLAWNFMDSGSSALVRRAVFDEVGFFDESLPAAEDWDLWLRIAWRHEFACVPHADILYRISAGAMSSQITRQQHACEQVFATALARLPPGADRDALAREGRANLSRYFTARALAGGATRLAFDYWWHFLRTTPAIGRDAAILLRLLARIGLAATLPAPLARRVSASAQRFMSRLRVQRQ